MSFVPSNSKAGQTVRTLQSIWGEGFTNPYYLVVNTHKQDHIRTTEFWDQSKLLLDYLNTTVPEVPISNFRSVRYVQVRRALLSQ